jgi:hypothetical protein
MLCRPGQHRKGDPEIVVLPHRVVINGAGLAIFDFPAASYGFDGIAAEGSIAPVSDGAPKPGSSL